MNARVQHADSVASLVKRMSRRCGRAFLATALIAGCGGSGAATRSSESGASAANASAGTSGPAGSGDAASSDGGEPGRAGADSAASGPFLDAQPGPDGLGTEPPTDGSASGGTDVSAPAPEAGGPPPPPDPAAALGHCFGPPKGASWSDAQAAYAKWKHDLVTTSGARGFVRVLRPNSPGAINTSNSEGTAYGMILAVAMDDQALFDGLWRYEQLFLDGNGLMNWQIDPSGNGPTAGGSGGATDADEDMAFALLWADHRWGGKGALATSYHDLAVKQIGAIWASEVDSAHGYALAPGDQFGGAAIVNISYFAPAYYRLFGQATGQSANWNRVVESSYAILAASLNAANKNESNGLVPAWSTPSGVPQAPAGLPTDFQLDSCRTPFRIGQDACWTGEPRAFAYLAKISAFYSQIGASKIVNGYDLDGTPNPTNPTVHQSAAFVGPAGVGAMSAMTFAPLRDAAYAGVATLNETDGSLYYTESWTALSLVMMNGGFWNPAR